MTSSFLIKGLFTVQCNPINTTTGWPEYFGHMNEVVILTGSLDKKNTLILCCSENKIHINEVILTWWSYGVVTGFHCNGYVWSHVKGAESAN